MSTRKRIRPVDDAKHTIVSHVDKTSLAERWIDPYKGRGVFATKHIEKGSFVLEYRGELISKEESDSRQKKYSEKQSAFLFDFSWEQKLWCIDASREDGSLGRLVNDDHKSPNCRMKRIMVDNKPHLCLFATDDIAAGTEITYNYGDTKWPWRENVGGRQDVTTELGRGPTAVPAPCQPDDHTAAPTIQVRGRQDVTAELGRGPTAVPAPCPPDDYTAAPTIQVGGHQDLTAELGRGPTAVPAPCQPDDHTAAPTIQVRGRQDVTAELGRGPTAVPAPCQPDDYTAAPTIQVGGHQDLTAELGRGPTAVPAPCQPDDHTAAPTIQVRGRQDVTAELGRGPTAVPAPCQPDDYTAAPTIQVGGHQDLTAELGRGPTAVPAPCQPDDHTAAPTIQVRGRQDVTAELGRGPIAVPAPCQPDDYTAAPTIQVGGHQDLTAELGRGPTAVPAPCQPDDHTAAPTIQVGGHQDLTAELGRGPTAVPAPCQPDDHTAAPTIQVGGRQDVTAELGRGPTAVPAPCQPDDYTAAPTIQVFDDSSLSEEELIPETSGQDSSSSRSFDITVQCINSSNTFLSQEQRLSTSNLNMSPAQSDEDYDQDSGDEYIPHFSEESSDTDCTSEPLENIEQGSGHDVRQKLLQDRETRSDRDETLDHLSRNKKRKKLHKENKNSVVISGACTRQEQSSYYTFSQSIQEKESDQESIDGAEGDSLNDSIFVSPVSKKEDGSRQYNKKHHCVFCGLDTHKMARHLIRKHQDEAEIAKVLSLPKNSKQRRLQLDLLRNRGDFEHNVRVIETGRGKLIPCKQPQVHTDGQEFLHCTYCFGLYTRRIMWRHFRVCKLKPDGIKSKPGKSRVQALCAFAQPVPNRFSDGYWKLISAMNQDKICTAIREDELVLEYGHRLFKKNEKDQSQHQHIRQKLRELGRLVLTLNKVTPLTNIRELIKPENYNHAVSAVRHTAGLNSETGHFRCPSLARKLGHSLHALATFVKSEALKKKDREAVQEASEFAQLYEEGWRFDISSQVLTQLEQSKWNTPQLLPFTQDVQILHSFLSDKQEKLLSTLKETSSSSEWADLTKVTLAQVILFNRRRAGEVSQTHLSTYLFRDTSETHMDVNLALSEVEKKLCKHFVRLVIRGKRGRKVPVLLTPEMKESLDVLVHKREECGILKDNVYLFARPASTSHYRGSDCIRQFVKDCNVKNPQALTSTKLRKHVATLSKVLNLKDTELDQLADFLGHDVRVHRTYYRLPEATLQLAKISKILMALEQGRLGEYKGQGLDEIHIEPNEMVQVDSQGHESEHECEDVAGEYRTETQTPAGDTRNREKTGKTSQVTQTSADSRRTAEKRGRQCVKKQWTMEETAAVKKHMGNFITSCRVPGKRDCERCLNAEPDALKDRDWSAIKFFIKNRITALKRQLCQ